MASLIGKHLVQYGDAVCIAQFGKLFAVLSDVAAFIDL
jgi:hypothetical protein